MKKYRLMGTIMLESTREEADYDFVESFDHDPSEMEVLYRMLSTGEIQIIHKLTVEE